MPSIFPIILNSSNVVPDDNSSYIYKFPRGSINLKNSSLAISQINLFYSWPNIDGLAYNNNTFQIQFPDDSPSTATIYDVVIPDGNYTVEQLNSYLQSFFIKNNKYLINSTTGQHVYYMEFLTNPQTYSIQIVTYEIPSSLAEVPGFVEGGGPGTFHFPGLDSQYAKLIITDNEFGTLLGFEPGTYFGDDNISSKTPQISPVSSILVQCSMVSNIFTNPDNIIYSFVSGSVEYGRMLSVTNQDIQYSNVNNGFYNEVKINFIDNNFKRLNIKDNNLIIYLIVKIND